LQHHDNVEELLGYWTRLKLDWLKPDWMKLSCRRLEIVQTMQTCAGRVYSSIKYRLCSHHD